MSRGMFELPVVIIIGSIFAGLFVGKYSSSRYNKTFEEAKDFATANLGDRQLPMTRDEEREWYKIMGCAEEERPTRGQLEEFLGNYK